MKLKLNPRSYQQLAADATIGLPHLGAAEFTFAQDYSEIVFPCRGGRFAHCIQRITTGPAVPPVWHWDGNKEEPTLTPSIGCDARCGWHGSLTKGVLAP